MKTKVITDSGSGLSKEQAEALGIGYLPLQVIVDEKQYLDGVDLNNETLYEFLEAGKMPTTSQPPLLLEEELFEQYKKDGITDILAINLSGGLSSTNQIVQATAGRVGLNVHTLDIYTTLFVQRYCAVAAAQLIESGMAPEEVIEVIKKAIDGSAGYLIVEDLDHLSAGGRLTPMAAKLGGMLKIKPILRVSKETEGKVDAFEKVRTMNKALKKAVDIVTSEIDPNIEYEFFVMDSANEEGSQYIIDLLKEKLGDNIRIHKDDLCAVIACHTGLGATGLQYIPRIEGVKF